MTRRTSKALQVAKAAALVLAASTLSCAASEEDACLETKGALAVYDRARAYEGCCWPGDSPFSDMCWRSAGNCELLGSCNM